MTETSDTGTTGNVRQRQPREGTRNRGAVDALQTKVVDCAMLCFLSEDGRSIESVFEARTGFARSTPEVLIGENLGDWPVLMQRLGHLRVLEVNDTADTTALSAAEAGRLNELHIGAALKHHFINRDSVLIRMIRG